MTYEEAMAVVDAGGAVSRESLWVMREAGFAWGEWVQLKRSWIPEDTRRDQERSLKGDWSARPIENSGPFHITVNTLCETFFFSSREAWEKGEVPDEARNALDWIDVTDRFESGCPKGYLEHTYPQAGH